MPAKKCFTSVFLRLGRVISDLETVVVRVRTRIWLHSVPCQEKNPTKAKVESFELMALTGDISRA